MTSSRPTPRPNPFVYLLRILAALFGGVLLYALTAAFSRGELQLGGGLAGSPATLDTPLGLLLAAIAFYPPPLWLLLAGLRPTLFRRRVVAIVAMVSLISTLVCYLLLRLFFL